jgi:CRP-like cAMP-binding protein
MAKLHKKEQTVTPDEVDKSPEKALELDLSITKLSAGQTQHEYQADEPIFTQGETANAVFYVKSGKVRLTVKSVDGEQAVTAILPEGSFLGESCLVGQTVRGATASALLCSTIARIEKQDMIDLLRSDPEFAERFLTYTLSRSIRMEADLVSHLFDSSEKRLARLLLTKASFGNEWKPIPVTANMSPESLAEIIGTTSSNVSLFLNRFRELGFIDSKGTEILVHSSLMSMAPHDKGVC